MKSSRERDRSCLAFLARRLLAMLAGVWLLMGIVPASVSAQAPPDSPLICNEPFADADNDGDVDLDDFGVFQRCYSQEGAVSVAASYCICFDRDDNGVVDASDLEAFQSRFSGPCVRANEGGSAGSSWRYVRGVTFTQVLTGYQVRIALDGDSFDFKLAQPNGEDLRFFDGTTELPWWRESWDRDSERAVVWVKVLDTTHGVSMRYGNPAAPDGSSGALTFELFDGLGAFERGIQHAATYQVTPTPYDGDPAWQPPGQVVHPSVVDFGATGWNGHRYWNAICSYPKANNNVEHPIILVSDDGTAWSVPEGLTNPIYGYHFGFANADTELFYNQATDELWVYFLKQDSRAPYEYSYFMLSKSSDGRNWSEAVPVMTFQAAAPDVPAPAPLSPAVLRIDSTYYMWAVRLRSSNNLLLRWTSVDGQTWDPEAAQHCSTLFPANTMYHHDIEMLDDGRLLMAYTNGSRISFAISSDQGLTWTNPLGFAMLPSASGWDNTWLYRSSCLIQNGMFRLWYSAKSMPGDVWHMGYTETPLSRVLGMLAGTDWTFDGLNEGVISAADGALRLTQTKSGPGTYVRKISPVPTGVFEVDVYDAWGDQSNEANSSVLPCFAVLRLMDSDNLYPSKEVGVGMSPNFGGGYRSRYLAHDRDYGNYVGQSGPVRSIGWHSMRITIPGDGSAQAFTDGILVRSFGTTRGVKNVSTVRLLLDNYNVPSGVSWTHQFRNLRIRKYAASEPAVVIGERSMLP